MIHERIYELVCYGRKNGLVEEADTAYVTNRLLEVLGLKEYEGTRKTDGEAVRPLREILDDMISYALGQDLIEEDTVTARDLFDTKLMGCLTPPPSVVRKEFYGRYVKSPKLATDYFYHFCMAADYIRTDRIKKDEKWVTDTEYGPIDITINLSKPEKDPREIAAAAKEKLSGYPACLLCRENEGYAGSRSHPARQNHRLIPVALDGEAYFFQYSPYVYYNEHCILLNEKHIPMKIDASVFRKLLDFTKQFPHYMAGSNADLSIVGGSILSHDHFQGGAYDFAMAKADCETFFTVKGFENVKAGIVKWPMSVIRLQSADADAVARLSDYILGCWRQYTDADAFIFHETDGVPHNTITPIARRRDALYEMDLVLRNNITTEECPWGVYHPTADLHHIKKENIGLIEVMGLAVLPARLKEEIRQLAGCLISGGNIRDRDALSKHADWVKTWRGDYIITKDTPLEAVIGILHDEIGRVFVRVLACAGVFKRTEQGREAFLRFVRRLGITGE